MTYWKTIGVVFIFLSCVVEMGSALGNQANGGMDESLMDLSVQPCDDFYQFACGGWLEKAEIPADLPMWDRSFMALRESNKVSLRKILEKKPSKKFGNLKNPDSKKLGDFYAACMDEKGIEKNSLSELNVILRQIETSEGTGDLTKEFKEQLPQLLAQMHLDGVNGFFNLSEQQDFKDSTQMIGVVDQAGLTLPDRDYYLNDDSKTLEVRSLFQKYMENIFGLMGLSPEVAQEASKTVLKLETQLAKSSMPRVDRRNPLNIYHRLERKGLKEKAPSFHWDQYFEAIGVPTIQAINVTVPEFFVSFNELLNSTPVSELKTYLKWHVIQSAIPALPNRFIDKNFKFVSQALSGQKQLEPRWKRCVKAVDSMMGFSLGRSYVEEYYSEESKKLTAQVIQGVEKSFENELQLLPWMDEATKNQALKKLGAIVNQVGYPPHWRSYHSLEVDRTSYFKTLLNSERFNSRYHLDKIGKPVDREEWDMSPPTVNAYYDPSMNKMVFPAGILQSPFFNQKASMETNFGGIGMVMGHELTHGFDDEGRRFDAVGNLVEWWTPKVLQDFDAKTDCVVKQYDAYESLPGVHLNGKLTLGENIADHGGIRLAFAAWKNYSKNIKMKPAPSRFTRDQRFFLGFAQSWCSKKRDAFARMLVKTDPHSPPRFRVNGTVSQFSEFSTAFQCKPGAPMAPVNRCVVW